VLSFDSINAEAAVPDSLTSATATTEQATIVYAGGNTSTNESAVATVSVSAQSPGSTDLNLTTVVVGTTKGSSYRISDTTNATLTVSKPSGVTVLNATSSDGNGKFANDGLHQDVNGDGTVTVSDVTAIFRHADEPIMQDRADIFDYNGDGDLTFADVTYLFNRVTT
jgi:hypothetical protein